MSAGVAIGDRPVERHRQIAAALRAEWRLIDSVSLRPCGCGGGFEAEVRLDPVVLRGAAEQQGTPATRVAFAAVEARRRAAIDECVRRVNERLVDADRIRAVSIVA